MNVYVVKKRKKPRTKKDNQFWHAKKRAFERYDIALTRSEHDYLVSRVRKGKVQLLEKQSNRIRVCMSELNGKKVKFVYDRTRKSIVSFLPQEEEKEKDIKKEKSPIPKPKITQEERDSQKIREQFENAQVSAAKLYGLAFTTQMSCDLISQVQQQQIKGKKMTKGLTVYESILPGKTVRFIYHKRRKNIVAFLPLEKEEKTCQ